MACSGDSILASYEGSNDDSDNLGTTSGNYGQAFTIPNDATICACSWYGGKGTVGTQPGTYKIELLSGSYNGTVIATTGSIDTTGMNDFNSPAWVKNAFASTVDLVAGTTYYLKMTALTGSINDVTRWFSDSSSPSYANGAEWRVSAQYTGRDKNFRIHGVEGGGAPTLVANVGSFTLTGTATALPRQLLLTASQATFTLTGIALIIYKNIDFNLTVATFSVTTIDVTFSRHYQVTCDTGTFTINGVDASLIRTYVLNVTTVDFTLTGYALFFPIAGVMLASTGVFTLDGKENDLLRGYVLITESSTFNLTCIATTIVQSTVIDITTVEFGFSGTDTSFGFGHWFVADTAVFTVTFKDSTLSKSYPAITNPFCDMTSPFTDKTQVTSRPAKNC